MSICWQLFHTNGTPAELTTDGSSPFSPAYFSSSFRCGVWSRLSLVAYPQSNGQAELTVKTAERIENGNTAPQGSLDSDNTAVPKHSNPKLAYSTINSDSIPSQPIFYNPYLEWIAAAQFCKEIFYLCNAKMVERYNKYTHHLCRAGDTIAIQSSLNRWWNITGKSSLSFQIVNTESRLMDQEESLLGTAVSWENAKSRLHPPQCQVQHLYQ